MDAERDTDGTTDAHEGDHTPADGAGTEGEGGKPDTRPGDRLAIIRRTLWWIGLVLLSPSVIGWFGPHDGNYDVACRILTTFSPPCGKTPAEQIVYSHRLLATLGAGLVCWLAVAILHIAQLSLMISSPVFPQPLPNKHIFAKIRNIHHLALSVCCSSCSISGQPQWRKAGRRRVSSPSSRVCMQLMNR